MAEKRRTFHVGRRGATRPVVMRNTSPGTWRAPDDSLFMYLGHAWLGPKGSRYRVEKWSAPHTDRTFASLQSALDDWERGQPKTAAQLDAEIAEALAKPAEPVGHEPDEWKEIDDEYAGTVQSLIDDGYTRDDARASAEDNIRETYGEDVVLWRPKHERRAREAQRKL
ncbi:MAG TPA: hypothetical protein VLE97_11580 [Gaiellaceae bacterium]|nr:hypothetical protein [Gaiellaceae bacterium]